MEIVGTHTINWPYANWAKFFLSVTPVASMMLQQNLYVIQFNY